MKGKFFKCECGTEALYVEHDPSFGTDISIFQRNFSNRSWKNRILLAWACLMGKPYGDQMIISDQTLADLVDHLTDIQNIKN